MGSEDHDKATPAKPRLSPGTSLSLLTLLVALGGATLHLMGSATHTVRIRGWGLDERLFPKATDWMLIAGYSSAFDRGVAILKLMGANLLWSLLAFVALSLYFAGLQSLGGFGSGKPPVWLEKQKEGVREFIRNARSTLLFVGAAFFLFGALLTLMAVPAMLGSSAGKAAVEREMEEYAKGCEKAIYNCVQLKKGGEVIGTGFILDSSPTHIAIFDVDQQRARSMPREGIETVALKIPKLSRNGEPSERPGLSK